MGSRFFTCAVIGAIVLSSCGGSGAGGSSARTTDVASSVPTNTLPLDTTPAAFPLKAASDGRYLVDQNGRPFLLQADAAWSLIVQLDLDETRTYLTTRRSQGFNALVVNLIEHRFADDPPRNRAGDAPFTTEGDFATPNAAYFDYAVQVVRLASDMGFTVLLAPAYLGYQGGDQGWYREMRAAGPDVLRSYGEYVGKRFADVPGIIWLAGGDFTPPDSDLGLVESVQHGIGSQDATHLQTAHWSPEVSAADVDVDFLQLNTTYTYNPVHLKSLADDEDSPLPHILIETAYENDIKKTNPRFLRGQAYDALLTGATGQTFGTGDVWQFRPNWRESLDTPGSQGMRVVKTLFDNIDWPALRPDVDHRFLTGGQESIKGRDYALAAVSTDGSLAVCYIPTARTVEVDLHQLSAAAASSAAWFDPTTGTVQPAAPSGQAGDAVKFVTPGRNAGDDEDWVLVFGLGAHPTT